MDHPGRDARRTAIVAVVLLALAGALIAVAYTGGLLGRDRAALAEAAETRTGTVNTVVTVWTEIGNTAASALLAIVVGAVLWWRGRRADGVFLIATMATASGVFTIIKRLLDRPRPPAELRVVEATNESLPSGHATMSAVVLASIVVLFWPQLTGRGRLLLAVACVLWSGGIGLTRIYLGVHWFSDVLAGWALGLAWAALGATALFAWRAYNPSSSGARPAGWNR